MVAAAKTAGKLLMVAHVLPFFPEFRFAAEAIRGGKYGKLLAAHFKRVIAKPDWSAEIGDTAKTGGPAVDLHIHDTHFIGLVCGVPKHVFSVGTREHRESGYRKAGLKRIRRDLSHHIVPLRSWRPGGDLFEWCGLHERPAVRARL